jgi:uncharacterized protein with von Willebrand factor type A (vWA) domain
MTFPAASGDGAQVPGYLLHNLLLFGQVLRRLGLDAGPGNMLDLVRATEYAPIGRKQDFRSAARCLLVHRNQDLALFDEAFRVFWRRPPTGQSTRDLRSMGEQRRYRQPQVVPPPDSDPDAAGGEAGPRDDQPAVDLSRTYSAREVLRGKDFADFTLDEIADGRRMLAQLGWDLGRRRTRRLVAGDGAGLDLRQTLRRNLKYGGELLELARREPKEKPRPVVLLCDVSGSMERYTRMLLHFIHTIASPERGSRAGRSAAGGRVEAFLFATRLTRITRYLSSRSIDQAVSEVAKAVPDWAGGTRIGETLKTFSFQWARRVLGGGAVVLIISDGWDRGEPELLAREMARLRRSCHRLIWLNPLLGSPTYQPLTRGMQAALPYVDDFLPVHNLNSLESLARHLGALSSQRRGRPHYRPLNPPNLPLAKGGQGGFPEPSALTPPPRTVDPTSAPTFRHPLWGQHPPP